MIIDITYDSSVSAAPAAFKTAINYVVNYLDSTFTNPVTLNIDVGWGESNGQALDASSLGQSLESIAPAYSYAQVRSALAANATTANAEATAASLPATDPTNGGNIDLGTADAKATGLFPANSTVIDGWVGFSSEAGTFTFDPSNRAVANEYDFIGVALHEITEVMGRDADLGSGPYDSSYTALDLFRYSAPGVRDLTTGGRHGSAYFSIDGGATDLDNFNTNPSGDYGDWASSAGNDAFLAFSNSGVENPLTSADLAVLEAIGWNVSAVDANPTSFVEQLYETVLLRPGSTSEVSYWANLIDASTLADEQVVGDVVASSETQNFILPIVRLYQTFFDRAPDPTGLSFWVNALRGGEAINGIADSFVTATEFQQHYGAALTPTDFVTALYQNVLGRAPDPAGERYWLNILTQGGDGVATQAQVALGFSNSSEFIFESTDPVDTWLNAAGLSGHYASTIANLPATTGGDQPANINPPSADTAGATVIASPDGGAIIASHYADTITLASSGTTVETIALSGNGFAPVSLASLKGKATTLGEYASVANFDAAGTDLVALTSGYAAGLTNGAAGAGSLAQVRAGGIDTTPAGGEENVFFLTPSSNVALTNPANVGAAIGSVKTAATDTFVAILDNGASAAASTQFGVYEITAHEPTGGVLGGNAADTVKLLGLFAAAGGFSEANYHAPISV